uniref:Ribonuclease H-like domain-containing protein n=1 Tax=Tanacetum cinerariifolium TaxID=118510 RepID=A0A6L2M142_TANCI|nr:ribonuclease H-like domain-containing protein [Tanacetum cinerariifolium]
MRRGDAEAEGDDEEQGTTDEEPVTTADDDQSIPLPTLPTLPSQQPHDIPSTSHVQSPLPQHQSPPLAQPQGAHFPMSLLQNTLDACTALTRRVKHLEHDKVAQDLKILKLKSRVKKLEKANKAKSVKLRRLRRVGTSQRIESSADTIIKDVSNQGRMTEESNKDDAKAKEVNEETEEVRLNAANAQIKGRQAEIYHIDIDHAAKVLSMQEEKEPEVQEAVEIVTSAKLITKVVVVVSGTVSATAVIPAPVTAATVTPAPVKVAVPATRRRRGVIIRDPEEESSTNTPAETKPKDKGKGILVEEPKPLKKKQQVEMDEVFARKLQKELNQKIDWEVSMDHVKQSSKESSYVQRYQVMKKRPVTEAQARRNMMKATKRKRLNEEAKDAEELKKHLEIVPDEDDDVFTEATPLARKVPIVDYQIIHALVKSWKLLTSCGVHIISFTTTQIILLVERRYPLLSFGVDAAKELKEKHSKCLLLPVKILVLPDEINAASYYCWIIPHKLKDKDSFKGEGPLELHQFNRLEVWELIKKPFGKTVVKLKWLWKNKKDEDQTVIRNKARLVAKGYAQEEGIDFKELFLPDGFVDLDHLEKVYRLRKALYGLKQSLRACNGTPLDTKPKLDADLSGKPIDQIDYHSKIRSLMYLTSSRLDLVQAMCYCARYQARPTERYLKEVKRIFRYLKDTINIGLLYPKDSGFKLTAFLDADHVRFINTHKSTSTGIQFLGNKLVSWMSKKQDYTATSLTEGEYMALSVSYAQVMWIRTQLKDYVFDYNKIMLYCDSQLAIVISCNPVQHSHTKHIHTRYHFIKKQVERGIIELYFVRTKYQLANMFMKSIPQDGFDYLVIRIGMRCLTPAELEVVANETA